MKYKAKLGDVVAAAHFIKIGGKLAEWMGDSTKQSPTAPLLLEPPQLLLVLNKNRELPIEAVVFDPQMKVEVVDEVIHFTDMSDVERVMEVYEAAALTPQRVADTCGAHVELIET